MMILLLLTLSAADPTAIYYTAPADPAARDAAHHDFPRHPVGTTLYAALDDVNVRAAAAADAPVVATLTLGTPVTVTQVRDGSDTVEGRTDTWYQVDAPTGGDGKTSGFIFGAALTPLRFLVDLDEDGEEEVVTVSMGWDYRIRVRVLEPAVTGKNRVQLALVEAAGGPFLGLVGGRANAELMPRDAAGLPLLHIVSAPEACASYSETWLSYRSAGRQKPGRLKVALQALGMVDPPVFSRFSVEWNARKKTAVLVRNNEAETDDGKPVKQVLRKRYSLKDGVYREITGK